MPETRSPGRMTPTRFMGSAAATVKIAVQENGKLRGTIEVPPGGSRDANLALARAEPNVARALEGKRVVKEIYVPDRIVNFVVAPA